MIFQLFRKIKINFIIEGKNFNLSKIIDQILFNNTDKQIIFDDKERIFKIKFKKNL